jgi:hypothetical protein
LTGKVTVTKVLARDITFIYMDAETLDQLDEVSKTMAEDPVLVSRTAWVKVFDAEEEDALIRVRLRDLVGFFVNLGARAPIQTTTAGRSKSYWAFFFIIFLQDDSICNSLIAGYGT